MPFCRAKGQQNAGTEIHDSNKALRSGRFVFAVVVFTRQIRERSNSRCTVPIQRCFPNAQTSSVLFPRLPLTTTHAHTVPFFRRLLLRLLSLWLTAAKVIRRQGRKGCVTPPQRACRAMRRKAGDMFERSESLTAQALATNSERQATKRLKDVLVTPEQSKWRPARRQPKFFEYFFSKKYIKILLL